MFFNRHLGLPHPRAFSRYSTSFSEEGQKTTKSRAPPLDPILKEAREMLLKPLDANDDFATHVGYAHRAMNSQQQSFFEKSVSELICLAKHDLLSFDMVISTHRSVPPAAPLPTPQPSYNPNQVYPSSTPLYATSSNQPEPKGAYHVPLTPKSSSCSYRQPPAASNMGFLPITGSNRQLSTAYSVRLPGGWANDLQPAT